MILIGLTCSNLITEGSTGNARLQNVVADGTISIERSTGCVYFDRSDAGEIRVKTSTGDVTGTLRTAKVFKTHSSTGDISVPNGISGGNCEITTTTGDIRVMIAAGE